MTAPLLYSAGGVVLFVIGLWALIVRRHLVRRILAFNVMGSGVFLVLVSGAARTEPPDPVPHALVLTGIVVAVSATAFALGLARRLHADTGSTALEEDR